MDDLQRQQILQDQSNLDLKNYNLAISNVSKDHQLAEKDRRIRELESQPQPYSSFASGREEELEKKIQFYEALLKKPLKEIAKENAVFRRNYMKFRVELAELTVSQRTYKEIAMQYGKQLGKSSEDVIADSEITKDKVINNTTEYGNSIDEQTLSDLEYEKRQAIKEAEWKKKNEIEREKLLAKYGRKGENRSADSTPTPSVAPAPTPNVIGKKVTPSSLSTKRSNSTVKWVVGIGALVGLAAIGLYNNPIVYAIPDNALMRADFKTKTFSSPMCVANKTGKDFQELQTQHRELFITYAKARKLKLTLDLECVQAGLIFNVTNQLYRVIGIEGKQRWNPDGTWIW